MKGAIGVCAFAVGLGACGFKSQKQDVPDGIDTTVQGGPKSASELPASCRPADPTSVQALYDLTEDSVHELITCGGIQMRLALSMKLMIFTSNEQLVSATARADIQDVISATGMSLENPFTQDANGSWVMNTSGSAGSTFSLDFFDPTTSAAITQNPFQLDTYLLGVTATSSQTWDEMKVNPTSRTTFTYNWTEVGPLSNLLADGGQVPNPIVLEMSLVDLGSAALGLGSADYGPFESVQNVQMESKVHMLDNRAVAQIAYDVTGHKDSVKNVVEAGSLRFDVDSLSATDGTYQLHADTSGLAYLGRGELAGELSYSVTGNGVNVRVTSDFGAGAAYPVARWECP
jgi:hypothetical protein